MTLTFSMLLGTTFAWFTDSEASGSNVILAGNLDIEIQYTTDGTTWNDLDGAEDLFSKNLWEPGHTEVVALRIENKGSLALKYTANMNIVEEIEGTNVNRELFKLSESLTVSTLVQQVNPIGDISLQMAFTAENGVAYEKTATFKNANVLRKNIELYPHEAHYVFVKIDMPESVGNEANYLTGRDAMGHDIYAPVIDFGMNVLAAQLTYEEDTFDNLYDKDALYDGEITSPEDFIAAPGGNLYQSQDIVYYNTDPTKQMICYADKEIVYDGYGHSITVLGSDPSVRNHGYVSFVPPEGESCTVNDLTVTGCGFVGLGYYGHKGGQYVANNLNVKNIESTLENVERGFKLGCAFMHFGTATLNNCTMTGTTAMIDGVKAIDFGCANSSTTITNGGKYGVIWCWSNAKATFCKTEIDTVWVAPIRGSVTVAAGTHIKTLNIEYGTYSGYATEKNLAKLVIENGATVDTINFKGVSYTLDQWRARTSTP